MDENEIIDAVCAHLERSGHRITQRLSTTQQGVDVIAVHPPSGRRLLIEAKGGTSSREGSNRFGKPYTQSQVFDRCGKGVFTALKLRAQEASLSTTTVLAAPDSRWFRSYLRDVAPLLRPLGVEVWLVSEEGTVSVLE